MRAKLKGRVKSAPKSWRVIWFIDAWCLIHTVERCGRLQGNPHFTQRIWFMPFSVVCVASCTRGRTGLACIIVFSNIQSHGPCTILATHFCEHTEGALAIMGLQTNQAWSGGWRGRMERIWMDLNVPN